MTTMIVDDLGRIPMSPYLTATLTRAADYATAQSHREVGLEHLLLALTEDPEATVVLKASNVDLAQLSAEVSEYLGRSDDRLQPDSNQTTAISTDLRRILEAAAAAARQGRRREINGAIVLAAIVGDGTSAAANFLRVQGLTFEEVIRALQRAAPVAPPPPAPAPAAAAPPSPAPAPVSAPARPPAPAPTPPPPPPVAAPVPRPEPQPTPAPIPAPPPPAPAPAPRYPSPPPTDFTQPASTEEILASARERLQNRPDPRESASGSGSVTLPRANYPDLGGPPHPAPSSAAPPEPEADPYANFGQTAPGAQLDDGLDNIPAPWPAEPEEPIAAPAPSLDAGRHTPRAPAPFPQSPAPSARAPDVPRTGPPAASERRRAASSGPFVGSWPLIEAGQLIENIPRRMRVALPVVVEARIARADVKALAEGLAGGGAVFRHEVVVTKAMSVRLRAPEGGFSIENRSPETQWIENVLGLASDDFASWRWTVTPRTRGKRQLQLIVSARTVGADGVTAETALPDQVIEVRVATNYGRTAKRWAGWIAAAVLGGLLAKFGEMGFVIVKLLIAKHFGG